MITRCLKKIETTSVVGREFLWCTSFIKEMCILKIVLENSVIISLCIKERIERNIYIAASLQYIRA